MPWIVGGAAIGGALIGSKSASKASKAQEQTSQAAIEEQRRQYDLSRSDAAPYSSAGRYAISALMDSLAPGTGPGSSRQTLSRYVGGDWSPMSTIEQIASQYAPKDRAAIIASLSGTRRADGADSYSTQGWDKTLDAYQMPGAEAGPLAQKFTVADFYADPVTKLGLQFGLDEGRKGLNNAASASGLRNSGQTLKALTKFGDDYAGSKAAESSGRFYGDQDRTVNRLLAMAGMGQTATNNTSATGQASAQNIGNIMTGAGNARGAAAIAQGNAFGNALNTIGGWWNQQNTLNRIFPQNPSSTSAPMNWGTTGDFSFNGMNA